jgi:hypothetical protein
MVAQQKLGLLAQRHIGSDPADSPGSTVAGKNLKIDDDSPIRLLKIDDWLLESTMTNARTSRS